MRIRIPVRFKMPRFNTIRKIQFGSIRMKTLLSILPAFLATLLLITLFSYNYSKGIIEKQIQGRMNAQLSSISNEIQANLSVHAKVPEVVARTLESQAHNYSLQQYKAMLSDALTSNPDTFGLGIYFAPYKYNPKIKYFSTYAYRDGNKIATTEKYNKPSYNYPNQDWYKIGMKKPGLTDPIYNPGVNATMSTFTDPFYGPDKNFLGVVTGDINLDSLQKRIQNTKVGKTGWAFLLDKQGFYIAGPDKDKIMNATIYGDQNRSLAAAGSKLMDTGRGMVKFSDSKGTYQLYHAKLPKTGWVICLVIPEKELYQPLKSLLAFILLISFAGLIIVLTAVYLYSRFVTRNLSRVNALSQTMAAGDFTRTLTIRSSDEFGAMAQNFNQMIENVRGLLSKAAGDTQRVASTSERLMAGVNQTNQATETVVRAIRDMAAGAESQLKGSQESAKSMEEMAAGIGRIAESSSHASDAVQEVSRQAQDGNEQMNQAIGHMNTVEHSVSESRALIHSLEDRSKQIGKIIGLITDISSQTNLLALNAAIEAARAGEHGRGFAVVSGEVKNLSEQTSKAAENVGALITEIQRETHKAVESMNMNAAMVQEGARLFKQAGTLFSSILDGIRQISIQIQEVSSSSEEISAGTQEVTSTVDQLAEIAQQASDHTQSVAASSEKQLASMDEIAASCTELAAMAEGLQELLKQFKVG